MTPLISGPLAPGAFRTTVFEPTLSFTVGEGWFLDSEAESSLFLSRGDAALNFASVPDLFVLEPPFSPDEEPFAAALTRAVDAPADLPRYFADVDGLETSVAQAIEVGGHRAMRVDYRVVRPPASGGTCEGQPGPCFVPFGVYKSQDFYIDSVGGAVSVIVVESKPGLAIRLHDRIRSEADAVLESLEVG